MSGLDKILEHITQEADAQVSSILDTAKENAQKLLASEKADADNMAEAIQKQSEHDVAMTVKRLQSSAQLCEKRIILEAKQGQIDSVFQSALERLEKLDDKAYSEVIGQMIDRYASDKKGQILLREGDVKRLSPEVLETIRKHNLTVSEKSADICGGFVLSYGDIEENCSFDVLIDSSREELQDRISQLLFC